MSSYFEGFVLSPDEKEYKIKYKIEYPENDEEVEINPYIMKAIMWDYHEFVVPNSEVEKLPLEALEHLIYDLDRHGEFYEEIIESPDYKQDLCNPEFPKNMYEVRIEIKDKDTLATSWLPIGEAYSAKYTKDVGNYNGRYKLLIPKELKYMHNIHKTSKRRLIEILGDVKLELEKCKKSNTVDNIVAERLKDLLSENEAKYSNNPFYKKLSAELDTIESLNPEGEEYELELIEQIKTLDKLVNMMDDSDLLFWAIL